MTDAQINLEIRLHSGRIEIAILLRLIMLQNILANKEGTKVCTYIFSF